jgi:glycosyltransferase involved in cell wall biosynthesis
VSGSGALGGAGVPGDEQAARPLLSIATPTRNRPELLERALGSVVRALAPVAGQVEVTVSDGSDDEAGGRVVERFAADWPGRHAYVRNRPALPLTENINRSIELGTGDWVLQLHDDDYLLPGVGAGLLDALRGAGDGERALLFGVEIVDQHGVRRREQSFRHEQYLEPEQALRHLLRNSSFVRMPACVVRRSAFAEVGPFDTAIGGPCDTEMWVRLFSRYGVRCLPLTTCAYTIHQGAATNGMWNPGTIEVMREIFDRAVALGAAPERSIRRWQADFFHQFILAGAYRRLRARQRAQAREVLRLFDLPDVRRLPASPKWLPVRAAFVAATAGPRGRS